MLRSTVSFLIVTYFSCLLIIFSNCIFPCPLLFLVIHSVHAGYLFCNWHSLNTNYLRTTFVGVPGSFNSDQIKCICCQNRPLFNFFATYPVCLDCSQGTSIFFWHFLKNHRNVVWRPRTIKFGIYDIQSFRY